MASAGHLDRWHPDVPAPSPRRVSRRKWWWLAGGCTLAWIAGLGVLWFFYAIGTGPSTRVVSAEQLEPRSHAFLRANGLLQEDETLLYFYSPALFDARSSGCFCTDRAVVEYSGRPGSRKSTRIGYDEIVFERLLRSARSSTKSVLSLDSRTGVGLTLRLARSDDGDVAFEHAVRRQWRRAQPEFASAAQGLWFDESRFELRLRGELKPRGVPEPAERVLALFGCEGWPASSWATFVSPTRVVVYSFDPEEEPDIWSLELASIEAVESRGPDGANELEAIVLRSGGEDFTLEGDRTLLWLFEKPLREAWTAARK